MARLRSGTFSWILVLGDLVVLTLVTFAGFAQHGTLETAGLRMLTTWAPLSLAWLLLAPHLGVFDGQRAADLRQLWRPFWAMILAAPLAGFLRAAWLGSVVQPVFVVVLGGVSALALVAWRFVYWWLQGRRKLTHG